MDTPEHLPHKSIPPSQAKRIHIQRRLSFRQEDQVQYKREMKPGEASGTSE